MTTTQLAAAYGDNFARATREIHPIKPSQLAPTASAVAGYTDSKHRILGLMRFSA
jgi:hypothetical protein